MWKSHFFSSWIVISIVAVNRDFPKRSLLFSVKREMPMLYFSWIVKGLLYFPWNVIYILFSYPTNFTANFENNLIHIGYLELRLKTCDNVKSVIVWNVSFRLASRSFKNTIFNRSKPMFWRSSSLENCNTYVALVNMKHSTESKTQTGFNRTITPWQNTFSLRTNVNGL